MSHQNSFMKFFFTIFFLLLIFAIPAQATLYMGIYGKVFDAETKTGVGRAKLILVSDFDGKLVAESSSKTDGTFFFKRVPKGMYKIFVTQSDSFIIPSEKPIPVTVPPGKNVIGVSVPVHKGGAIKGRIVTNQGNAVPDARITDGKLVSTVSDSNGNFFLRGIPAGELKIAVMSSGLGVKAVNAISEKNKTTDLGNITFNVSLANTLRGKVVNTDNEPVPNAILVTHNDNSDNYSAGFTIANDNGEFIITGLNTGKHKLLVVSNGYDILEIPEINVPVNQTITLTPSATQTSGISDSVIENTFITTDSIFSKMLNFIAPNNTYAASCPRSCPDGKWSGAVTDISLLFLTPLGIGKDGGATMTIGSLGCWSSPSKLQITTVCPTAGVGNVLANMSIGISGLFCNNACCSDNLLGPSFGGMASYGPVSASYNMDFSAGATCRSVGISLDVAALKNSMEKLGYDIEDFYLGGVACQTEEMVNVFDYWAGVLGI